MSYICIGDSWPKFNPSDLASDAHFVRSKGMGWYHNVYAGPFCKKHQDLFQLKAVRDYEIKYGRVEAWHKDGKLEWEVESYLL